MNIDFTDMYNVFVGYLHALSTNFRLQEVPMSSATMNQSDIAIFFSNFTMFLPFCLVAVAEFLEFVKRTEGFAWNLI